MIVLHLLFPIAKLKQSLHSIVKPVQDFFRNKFRVRIVFYDPFCKGESLAPNQLLLHPEVGWINKRLQHTHIGQPPISRKVMPHTRIQQNV